MIEEEGGIWGSLTTVEELVLCVEEACTNAIRHSGCPEPGEIILSILDETVEICVRDRGKGLDLGAIDYAFIAKSRFDADPYFDGKIDEFRVYNRALSAAEVLALYNFTGP